MDGNSSCRTLLASRLSPHNSSKGTLMRGYSFRSLFIPFMLLAALSIGTALVNAQGRRGRGDESEAERDQRQRERDHRREQRQSQQAAKQQQANQERQQ